MQLGIAAGTNARTSHNLTSAYAKRGLARPYRLTSFQLVFQICNDHQGAHPASGTTPLIRCVPVPCGLPGPPSLGSQMLKRICNRFRHGRSRADLVQT